MVEGHSLSIDESAMTGESDPVMKDRKTPFLLSGCKVQDGQGSLLVS
jgi:Ca2+-transporting ATPase